MFLYKKVYSVTTALLLSGLSFTTNAAETGIAPVNAAVEAPKASTDTAAKTVGELIVAIPSEKEVKTALPADTETKTVATQNPQVALPVEPAAPKAVKPEIQVSLPVESATVTPPKVTEAVKQAEPALSLDSEEQKRSYATGVAMAHYIQDNIARQKSLHMTLNRELLLAGMNDTFNNTLKMNEQDIKVTLTALEEQVKILTHAEEAKKQAAGALFLDNFAKREGVKKTTKGLLYLIDNKGEGDALKDTDKVVLRYKGTLTDGTVVDGPNIDDANEIFLVANMPPVLSDAVKLIRKGGQITIVIPPGTVKSAANNTGKSPDDTVLIYTISILDVIKP